MKARVLFISEKELMSTSGNYALAGSVCNEERNSVYIRLEDVIDFIQTTQNATAEEMIKLQEQVSTDGNPTDTTAQQSSWRTLNWILSELKKYKV